MKKSLLLIALLSSTVLSAQFENKKIDNAETGSKIDLSNAIDFEKIDYKASDAKAQQDVALKNLLGIDFNIDKQSYFKTIRHDSKTDFLWMTGFVFQDKSAPIDQKASQWISLANQEIGLSDNSKFKQIGQWQDSDSEMHIKFEQIYDGQPVFGAEMILHTKNGILHLLNGKLISEEKINKESQALVDKESARKIVKAKLNNYTEDLFANNQVGLNIDIQRWNERLVYYPVEEDVYDLVHHIVVLANAAERYEYFVHAETGEIINYFSSICNLSHEFHNHSSCVGKTNCDVQHEAQTEASSKSFGRLAMDGPAIANADDLSGTSREINTYEFDNDYFLIDASREMFNSFSSELPNDPVGVIWTIDLNNTSPVNDNSLYTHINSFNNSWSNAPEGVSAHYNAGQAYDYFKDVFNRNSISGTGQNIVSFVNVTDPDENSLGNAFWNGIGIYYGNGDEFFLPLGRGLDVAGHEMSHGVIENTANLIYQDESGAINEAFADIFGAMIDREDWNIGEDVVRASAFPSGALRSLSDPHNGAAEGDFARGWQPRHYDERYTGQEDNGGVHINSGIVNHAFYRFAQKQNRSVAEQVFYRALSTYLTRSSDFDELRFAVVQSALDLYGANTAGDAREAFDEVGITDESETDLEEDFDINPGQDLLLVSDRDLVNLYLFDLQTGSEIYNPLASIPLLSKPSVTDDGSRIVFVGTDNHVHLIDLDWSVSPPNVTEEIISVSADWRNAVISKNGRFIALLENAISNNIIVFDLATSDFNTYQLYNPTYSTGISTGEVQYADVMEFDATSSSIMYDAFNVVNGSSGEIEFWDIGFLEVWNPDFDTWALGNIEKLFNSLPEGINIGNPTFSKNTPFIVAFDIFDGTDYEIIGLNLETQDVNSIIPNTGLAYPSYSRDDGFMIYDLEFFGYTDLGVLELQADKISRVANSDQILLPGGKWGIWFSNGERDLTSVEYNFPELNSLAVMPNPAVNQIRINADGDNLKGDCLLTIVDGAGRLMIQQQCRAESLNEFEFDVSGFGSGVYYLTVSQASKRANASFVIK